MANIYKVVNPNILSGDNGGGGSPVTKYIQTFNSTIDWGSPSGGYYTITINAATHALGTEPTATIYELNGANYEEVTVDRVSINPSGDVSIRVTEIINTRFAGRIVII
jgi:hypothetical protein